MLLILPCLKLQLLYDVVNVMFSSVLSLLPESANSFILGEHLLCTSLFFSSISMCV